MLNDRKITDWTQPVSSLDDRPQMTASALKAAFDSNTNQLKPAVNGMIDDLTGTTGAGNIGVEAIAGVTGTTVQAMLAALKALIDLCDTEDSVDDKLDLKADKTTTDKLIKSVSLDAETGVFTFTTDDGTQTTIDTMLEKIPVNCYLDGQEFVLVLDDGTEQRADLSDFLTPTEFTDSSTIDFSVSGSTVTATIKNGSITLAMLESTVMSTIQGYVTAAQTAAGNASTSETNAGTYRDQAQTAATNSASSASESGAKATLSQSWAIGGTGTRAGEDTNNSKYFAQQSAGSASTAQGWSDSAMEQADAAASSASAAAGSAATASQAASNAANQVKTELQGYVSDAEDAAARAEQAAEDAEAIVGGDYIPNSQKGVAGGVATLDSSGKVPSGQLPEMNYIPTSQKGSASGVASLDASGKLESTQKPDYTAAEVGALSDPGGGTTGQILTKTASGAAWSDAPDTGVTTFNSRTGAVMPQTGDYTADMVGAVPTTRKVNGKAMSADVTLSAADVGAIAEPDGGTTGQILTKADSGAEWADPPETGAPLQGLPTNDIRTYPVREGQSISAGDVVNVGREIVSGTTYGDLTVGSTVQINENGSPVDYLVVHQGNPDPNLYDASCDGTWLLRKDIAENRVWDAGNVNAYADSDINDYLNGGWLGRYDSTTLGNIKQVKIPYCVGNGSSTINSGANGLSVKAFFLGGSEVGWSSEDNQYFSADGAKLDFFMASDGKSANQKRIAALNGLASTYALRSPISDANGRILSVLSDGFCNGIMCQYSLGIRPCIIFDSAALLGDDIVYGPDTIYNDVVPQDNVEKTVISSAVSATCIERLTDAHVLVYVTTSSYGYVSLIDGYTGEKILGGSEDNSNGISSASISKISDQSIIKLFIKSSTLYANTCTITEETTISFGSQYTVASSVSNNAEVIALSDSLAFSIYNSSGLKCKVLPISGTTITTSGTVYSLPNNTGANYISACRLPDEGGNKRVCICFADTGDGNKGKAVIATIDSNNAVTFGDVVTIWSTSVDNTSCTTDGNVVMFSSEEGIAFTDTSLLLLQRDDTEILPAIVLNVGVSKFVRLTQVGIIRVVQCDDNEISKGEQYTINNGKQTLYASLALTSANSVIAAYADSGNSNYGTTTILEVNGNQIAGSFLDTSSDAIALADGTGGQPIPVGFGGYCECPGVTEGDTIDSSGVCAYSPDDGWLKIVDEREKRVITGTFTTGQAGTTNSVNLGFKPSVVMVYDYNNNTNTSSIPGASGSQANTMNCIRIIATETGSTKLTDTGFNIVLNVLKPLWYVAWR